MNYPVTPYIEQISQILKNSSQRSVVITAETGAGKSTVLPAGLLEHFSGRILMTEPRRIAALGVSERISFLLGEECGKTCGYRIHLESRISKETRLEVVTEAVLVRFLQEDPALEKYDLVILDEFHERSVNLDMALAFLREAMELREDLRVIVMSATIDSEKISAYFGGCPCVDVPGRTFPVKNLWWGQMETVQAVEKAVSSQMIKDGTILVFLPGLREIKRCREELESLYAGLVSSGKIQICALHSSVSLEEQKAVLKPALDGVLRIVVSSSIAETSLTIPDVKLVIDSGLCRINKINVQTGMSGLVTLTESEFNARQRAGRAGRLQEGICIKLWNQGEGLINEFPPEILRTDLTELVLECADRGVTDLEKISWLDSPPSALWNASVNLLESLGFTDADGKITRKGRASLKLGLSPRLSGVILSCAAESKVRKTFDFVLKYSQYGSASPSVQKKFISDLERRFSECKKIYSPEEEFENLPAVLAGFPDRVARLISEPGDAKCEYQFTGGRKASVHPSIKHTPEWICVPEVNLTGSSAVIYSFEELSGTDFERWLELNKSEREVCSFEDGKIFKVKNVCLGEIVLKSVKMPSQPEDFSKAWCNEIRTKGIKSLPLDSRSENFLVRREFYELNKRKTGGESDNLLEKLQPAPEEWLVPFMAGKTKLDGETVYNALYWFLNGSEIDFLCPEQLVLETGRKVRVKYEKISSTEIRPSVEVIIQRIFGCFKTPRIMEVPVILKLLSPASRSLQITSDLENFWQNTWPEICKEMKGRYPKHNWDYRVAEDN